MENFYDVLSLNSLVRHYSNDVTKLLTTSIAWEKDNPDSAGREIARDSLCFSLQMCLRYLSELNNLISSEFGNQFFVNTDSLLKLGLLKSDHEDKNCKV